MQLIIISPPGDFSDEHQTVSRILRQTPAVFHLRKPECSRDELAAYLERIPDDLHPRIMVHGHPDLLDRFDIGGVVARGAKYPVFDRAVAAMAPEKVDRSAATSCSSRRRRRRPTRPD